MIPQYHTDHHLDYPGSVLGNTAMFIVAVYGLSLPLTVSRNIYLPLTACGKGDLINGHIFNYRLPQAPWRAYGRTGVRAGPAYGSGARGPRARAPGPAYGAYGSGARGPGARAPGPAYGAYLWAALRHLWLAG